MKKETLKAVLIDEIIEYFANSINTETLIKNAFKKTVSPEDEKKVSNLLDYYQKEWENEEVSTEGETEAQSIILNSILDKCANEIINVFNK